MRVLSVVGNRPQFIKSAPLSVALRDAAIDEVVLHTGQHWDPEMSQIFFDELQVPEPAYRLETHSADVERMKPLIRAAVGREAPDWLLVYGDTNSTLAGAQSANGVAVAHVEAGLRSFDLTMPEERNRIEVDKIAALLLCPDERSARQLASEGVRGRVAVVGDVMADASRLFVPIARQRSRILERLEAEPDQYVVMTIHREANATADRLGAIAADVNRVARRVIFPVHPRTRKVIDGGGIRFAPSVQLVEPLGFLDFTALASQATTIVTDSGGLQKEAYWFGIPCITVRPSTEWVDTVEASANVLVEPGEISAAVADVADRGFPRDAPVLYGDGYASERVAEALYATRP
jgi:UDP-N-acetylglucosamine 2-epimerase